MNRLEKVLGVLTLIALIFKLFIITGGGILLALSLTGLAIIYFPLGFVFFNQIRFDKIFNNSSYQGLSVLRIIGTIGAGISLSTLCLGILFKLNHWGGSFVLLKGLLSISIILIIVVLKYFQTKSDLYSNMIKRILIVGLFGLLIYLI